MDKIKINNTNYEIRNETLNGIPHLVVPVIMMREGVHAGSHGPIHHTAAQLSRYVEAWNGIPVTIGHPKKDGSFVSANVPEVLESYATGQVFNTRMNGDRLMADAWIAVSKIQALSQITLDMINNGDPLDVSVGVFSDDLPENGNWNGEAYSSIATNYRPDHLALLPYETGACSFDDGCGVRNNNNPKTKNANEMDVKEFKAMTLEQNPISVNQDFTERASSIQRILDGMDTEGAWHYLQELFEDHFFYKVSGSGRQPEYFKQMYSENENDEIVLDGEPQKVVRSTDYAPVQVNTKMRRTKPTKSKKVEPIKTNEMDVKEKKVADLIANTNSCFCQDDSEYLLTQSDEKLDKFIEKSNTPAPVVNTEAVIEPKPEEVKPVTYASPDEFINTLPTEMQDSLKNGLKLHNAQRAATIAKIQTNAKDVWTPEELNDMSSDMLDKVASSIPVATAPVDYSLNGSHGPVIEGEVDDILMPTDFIEKK